MCQKVITKLLARLGFVVTIAGNGQVAVDLFEQAKGEFDFVLMARARHRWRHSTRLLQTA